MDQAERIATSAARSCRRRPGNRRSGARTRPGSAGRRARAGGARDGARSVQTIDERCSPFSLSRIGRMANGPPGRNFSWATPRCGSSWRATSTIAIWSYDQARAPMPASSRIVPNAALGRGDQPRREHAGRFSGRSRPCRHRARCRATSSGATSSTSAQAASRRSIAARRKRFSTIQPIGGAGRWRSRRRAPPRDDRNAGRAGWRGRHGPRRRCGCRGSARPWPRSRPIRRPPRTASGW